MPRKLVPLDKAIDNSIGPKGTPARTRFDKEVSAELKEVNQIELKMKKLPPFLDIKTDNIVVRYNLFLTPHSYRGGGWEIMYVEPETHNKLISLVDTTIEIAVDKLLNLFKSEFNEYLPKEKRRDYRRRSRTHRKITTRIP